MEEGVLVVKKDAYLKKHQHIDTVPNLIVMMVIKSMKSKGYVEEVFSWQWSYYFLNETGIKFLAKTLGKLHNLQVSQKELSPSHTRRPSLQRLMMARKKAEVMMKRAMMRSQRPMLRKPLNNPRNYKAFHIYNFLFFRVSYYSFKCKLFSGH